DPAELLNVALKTDHKDAGISALERSVASLTDGYVRETLENVATRAKSKGVQRRARAMVQAIDEQAAARRQAIEDWRARLAEIVARVEAVGAQPGTPDARATLAAIEAEWHATSTDAAFELEPATAARFEAALETARSAIARHEHEEDEHRAVL